MKHDRAMLIAGCVCVAVICAWVLLFLYLANQGVVVE